MLHGKSKCLFELARIFYTWKVFQLNFNVMNTAPLNHILRFVQVARALSGLKLPVSLNSCVVTGETRYIALLGNEKKTLHTIN